MNKLVWKNIDWISVQKRVNRYQRRIYKASSENNSRLTKTLQKRLIRSLDSRLLAVRRITTENKGKNTAGIDNKLYNTDDKKIILVNKLRIDGKASPIKRVYIPKPGKTEKRPLGIPIVLDRAKQYLVLLALEPEWEAKFEPNSYGFRPGRSCHDAVIAIFGYLRSGKDPNFKRYILDADLKGCFDNINHEYLLNKVQTLPEIKAQIKAWLEAGIIEPQHHLSPEKYLRKNQIGTPQGGIISPFLANVALHGMEEHLKQWISTRPSTTGKSLSKRDKMKGLGIIRYADDFIITHRDKQTILDVKTELQQWLYKTSNLSLNNDKTKIITSTEGFNFLGFHFINVKRQNTTRIKIYPQKDSVKKLTQNIGNILKKNRSISSYDLIEILRPIIVGWCNYYSICECSYTFSILDHKLYQMLRSWVFRRDRRHGRQIIKEKYFPSNNTYTFRGKVHRNNWILTGKKVTNQNETKTNYLPLFSWTESQTHIKIRSYASIYDGNYEYWNNRSYQYAGFSYSQKKLLRRQKGFCTWCKNHIFITDIVEIDHILPKSKMGTDNYHNLQLLHKQCHNEKTLFDRKSQ